MNAGVEPAAIEREFGAALAGLAMEKLARLVEDGLLVRIGKVVRLTARGRLLANEVFQEFIALDAAKTRIRSRE